MTSDKATTDSAQVRSLDRGLLILDSFINQHVQSLHQVATGLNLPKSTTHRLLSTLQSRGYIRPTNENGVYELAVKGIWMTSVRNRIHRKLEWVQHATGETVNFGVLVGNEVEYVDRVISDHALRWGVDIGSRIQLNCSGMGKAILAFREDLWMTDEVLSARTPRTMTDWSELKAHCAVIRQRGFALDDQEFIEGVTCLAVPVRDESDTVVAALSVSGPSVRFSEAVALQHAPLCIEAAAHVSAALGYIPPDANP